MAYNLQPVERVSGIDRQTFLKEYYRPGIPVVITDYSKGWPALQKWNYQYFKNLLGDHQVPLYDSSKADGAKKVNEPAHIMAFSDYLDLIEKEPSDLRIFLFNIFNERPELCRDFFKPALTPDVLTRFPMMFFGGRGSSVFLHYDMDLSHVYHTHFGREKRVLLFENKYSRNLYRLPFSVHNIEDIDMENPDFEKWPALKKVNGYRTILSHGDTLFMPSGMWHYMNYTQAGFSLSLRSVDTRLLTKLRGLLNLTVMRQIDNFGRKLRGADWIKFKENLAIRKAERGLSQ